MRILFQVSRCPLTIQYIPACSFEASDNVVPHNGGLDTARLHSLSSALSVSINQGDNGASGPCTDTPHIVFRTHQHTDTGYKTWVLTVIILRYKVCQHSDTGYKTWVLTIIKMRYKICQHTDMGCKIWVLTIIILGYRVH